MNPKVRMMLAKEIMRAAKCVVAADGEDFVSEAADPKLLELIHTIRPRLKELALLKGKKLSRFGVGPLMGNATVEDLLRSVGKILGI